MKKDMLDFQVSDRPLARVKTECLAIGLFEEDSWSSGPARTINSAMRGRLKALTAAGDLPTRLGDAAMLLAPTGVSAKRLIVVGLGSRKTNQRRGWRKAMSAVLQLTLKSGARDLTLALERPATTELDDYYLGRGSAEASAQALYRINDLKTARRPKVPALRAVILHCAAEAKSDIRRGLRDGTAIAAGQNLLRDLGNLPGNICTPRYLADCARAIAKEHRELKVSVLDEAGIKRERMGCLLAVSQGSAEPPRFIVLEYHGGAKSSAPVVLVGKGVTFDTGGISLKDPAAMDEMKYDMCGAASVLASIKVAALLKLRLNLVGLVPAVENMPSGRATKPGDIATSAAGKTVEILNTDAEGRLILCDALHYARRFKPSAVVDIATLTGACVIALGHHHTGVMANSDSLARELTEAGLRSDDRAWRLPLTEDYVDQLKSNFADLANIGGRDAGAITAAAFLSKFVEGLNWAHLDIAGTAWTSGVSKGATGRPVPLLADFLIQRAGPATG
jgi:leucyl aminopeptidase